MLVQKLVLNTLATNKVVEKDGKWFVESADGSKTLGGPYDDEDAAKERLRQIEYFKHNTRQSVTANLSSKKVRRERLEGKEYLVVPVVMITEGVHAGSNGPLFYPPDEVSKTPAVWNHKPIVVYHPMKDGQAISACDVDVLNTRKVGLLLGTEYDTIQQNGKQVGRLKSEAWLDPARLKEVDDRILQAIEAGTMMEVSTGLFTDNSPEEGEWNGEHYDAIARNYRPDHLAILPDQVGACSIADGAGLLRNEAFQGLPNLTKAATNHVAFLTSNELSDRDVAEQLAGLLEKRANGDGNGPMLFPWPSDVYKDYCIYCIGQQYWKQAYTVENEKVTLVGLPVEVVRSIRYTTLSGEVVNKENRMSKKELVDGLIANTTTPWEESDRKVLMEMSETKLAALIPATNAATAPSDMTDAEKKKWDGMSEDERAMWLKERKPKTNAAETQAATNANPTPKAPATLEEYINNAPAEMQDVIREGVLSHNAEKSRLVKGILANAANTFTEAQLRAKPIAELRSIGQFAIAKPKPTDNYAGLGDGGSLDTNTAEEPLVAPSSL